MALTGVVVDDFSGTLALWDDYVAGVTIVGGRARIVCDTGYNQMRTTRVYTVKGSQMSARVWVPALGGAAVQAYVAMSISTATSGTAISMEYEATSGNLRCFNRDAWSDAGAVEITYDSTAHAYWRMRETGGTLYYETSPDGSTWTSRRTSTSPLWVTGSDNTAVEFIAHRDSGTNDYAEIDNVNTAGAVSATGSAVCATATAAARAPAATGVRNASVTAVRATGTAAERTATAAAGARMVVVQAAATGLAQPPAFTTGALATGVVTTGAGLAAPPTVSGTQSPTVAAPTATSTSTANPPVTASDGTATATAATGAADSYPPSVTAVKVAAVNAATATTTATALPPVVETLTSVTAPAPAVAGAARAPVITAGAATQPPTSTGASAASAPAVEGTVGVSIVNAVTAGATGQAPTPQPALAVAVAVATATGEAKRPRRISNGTIADRDITLTGALSAPTWSGSLTAATWSAKMEA